LETIANESSATNLRFNDRPKASVDLLVGADGSWSEVRRHILRARDEVTAEKRWVPAFMGATGFYGISSSIDDFWVDNVDATDTHGIWLNQGKLSSSPLPNGKTRWDLQLPERGAPEVLTRPASGSQDLWSKRQYWMGIQTCPRCVFARVEY
jgi:2-polyprenyl-6-methoxyphenol hydroxylase-like FAD-dependent oxidoreductase